VAVAVQVIHMARMSLSQMVLLVEVVVAVRNMDLAERADHQLKHFLLTQPLSMDLLEVTLQQVQATLLVQVEVVQVRSAVQ
jgi:hypothetical protein